MLNGGSGTELVEQQQVGAADLVLVKVRYKDVDAGEEDAAHEVKQALAHGSLTAPDLDLQWAGAVATFAEILKRNPYANGNALPELRSVLEAQAGRDAKRDEFIELFSEARVLLSR